MADEQPPRTGAPDEYAAKYMEGNGRALYHDKIRAPRLFHALFLLPLAILLGSALVAHTPALVPLLSALPISLVWLLFSTLRVSVTTRELHVQYGLFGPRIPIEAIESCAAVDYDWKKYGGWGIRFGADGSVAYNMLGDGGRAVRVTYRKGKATKTVLMSSREPERLAAAIQTARSGALTTRSGPRLVEAPPARIDAALAEVETRAAMEGEPEDEQEIEAPPVSEKRRI